MGRTRFVALAKVIADELAARPFKKAIYAKYQDQLGVGYRQFLYYVRELESGIGSFPSSSPVALAGRAARHPPADLQASTPPAEPSPRADREPLNARRPPPKRFIFDPTDIDLTKLI
jgi:hypothetical protein